MEYRAKLIGVASLLLCVAFASQALTLGRIRGAALIGQPLNMVVPVQIGAGEDASAACFEAEVFHADARQDPSRVKLAVEPSGQADALNVRIMSSVVVDEPVVTVYLRTLCDQKATRRYVLLADFPSDVGPAVAPVRAPSVPAVAPAANPAPAPLLGAATDTRVTPVVVAPAPAVRAAAPVKPKPKVVKQTVKKPVKTAPAPKPGAAAPAVAATLPVTPVTPSGQPRLTLEAPLLLSEQADVLALTPPPSPSAEAQRDALKIQTLESDVKALLALAAKNEASLLDLRTRLQAAESERLPNWMAYALGALVLACLAVIALLLRRQRQVLPDENSHWSASVAAVPPGSGAATDASAIPAPGRVTMPGALDPQQPLTTVRPPVVAPVYGAVGPVDGPVTQVDVSLLEMSESGFDNLMQSGVAHSAIRKPSAPKPVVASAATATVNAQAHNLNSSAVFDVRQQAEFFVSLGQTDQAVRILEKHISDSDDPNPHVYLDLLAIFHSLSLKVDFRQFREDFNLLFNGRVQEFAAFKDEGQDLEAYPAALVAISAVWPSAQVLTVIESFIFRDPWETGNQPFDLAAFRDLLLLHAVAQRILVASPDIAPSASAAGAAAQAKPYFADSGLSMPLPMPSPYAYTVDDARPGATAAAAGSAEVDLDLNFDNVDVDLDLDLDLSDMPAAPAAGQDMGVDMDLDLSLPLSDQMELALPSAKTPAPGNLIDFDISDPAPPVTPDGKTPG